MKKKKGFTLIELLAVIVVLAIIALIATPIVMNTIKDAKKGAMERSADGYIKQVELTIATKQLDREPVSDGTYSINSEGNICLNDDCSEKLVIEVSGNKPSSGSIVIENSAVKKDNSTMYIEGYNIIYDNDKSVAWEPYKGVLCTKDTGVDLNNLEYGDKFTCELGDNDNKTFYVLELNGDNVSLIMNMNIDSEGKGTTEGNTVAWCGDETLCKTNGEWDNTKGPITANNFLQTSTTNWTKLNKNQISLPSAEQIATASGKAFDGSPGVTLSSSWLYENLNNPTPPYRYWTSTFVSYTTDKTWFVDKFADIGYLSVYNAVGNGVRPVITISKTNLG